MSDKHLDLTVRLVFRGPIHGFAGLLSDLGLATENSYKRERYEVTGVWVNPEGGEGFHLFTVSIKTTTENLDRLILDVEEREEFPRAYRLTAIDVRGGEAESL